MRGRLKSHGGSAGSEYCRMSCHKDWTIKKPTRMNMTKYMILTDSTGEVSFIF